MDNFFLKNILSTFLLYFIFKFHLELTFSVIFFFTIFLYFNTKKFIFQFQFYKKYISFFLQILKVYFKKNTINDTSNTKLSEILIQGYDMGVIKGIELLNKNPEASDNVKKILNEFIHIQENNIDRLKKFL